MWTLRVSAELTHSQRFFTRIIVIGISACMFIEIYNIIIQPTPLQRVSFDSEQHDVPTLTVNDTCMVTGIQTSSTRDVYKRSRLRPSSRTTREWDLVNNSCGGMWSWTTYNTIAMKVHICVIGVVCNYYMHSYYIILQLALSVYIIVI